MVTYRFFFLLFCVVPPQVDEAFQYVFEEYNQAQDGQLTRKEFFTVSLLPSPSFVLKKNPFLIYYLLW